MVGMDASYFRIGVKRIKPTLPRTFWPFAGYLKLKTYFTNGVLFGAENVQNIAAGFANFVFDCCYPKSLPYAVVTDSDAALCKPSSAASSTP